MKICDNLITANLGNFFNKTFGIPSGSGDLNGFIEVIIPSTSLHLMTNHGLLVHEFTMDVHKTFFTTLSIVWVHIAVVLWALWKISAY